MPAASSPVKVEKMLPNAIAGPVQKSAKTTAAMASALRGECRITRGFAPNSRLATTSSRQHLVHSADPPSWVIVADSGALRDQNEAFMQLGTPVCPTKKARATVPHSLLRCGQCSGMAEFGGVDPHDDALDDVGGDGVRRGVRLAGGVFGRQGIHWAGRGSGPGR